MCILCVEETWRNCGEPVHREGGRNLCVEEVRTCGSVLFVVAHGSSPFLLLVDRALFHEPVYHPLLNCGHWNLPFVVARKLMCHPL